jgi:hypothetical protein
MVYMAELMPLPCQFLDVCRMQVHGLEDDSLPISPLLLIILGIEGNDQGLSFYSV